MPKGNRSNHTLTSERARELNAMRKTHGWDQSPGSVIGKPIGSERARELSGLRKTFGHGGGRPRDPDQARCACGQMTLKRALTRGHICDERFYEEDEDENEDEDDEDDWFEEG